jgi:hypothetical protein
MAMNKQQKQLAILVPALVILAGLGAWHLGVFGSSSPPPKARDKAAQTPPRPAQTVQTPRTPAARAAAARAAETVEDEKPLDIPPPPGFVRRLPVWPVEAPSGSRGWQPRPGEFWPYDPLFVQNIDVADPGRREYIDRLFAEWRLDGISRIRQPVPVQRNPSSARANSEQDLTPEHELAPETEYEVQHVWEAWFSGQRRPFRVNDRLPGTRFTIEEIFRTPQLAGVRLLGDTGARIVLPLTQPTRHGDDARSRGARRR